MVFTTTPHLEGDKERLVTFIDSLPLGVIMTDSNDRIFAINPTIGELLSLARKPHVLEEIATCFGNTFEFMAQYNLCKETKISQTKDILFQNKYFRLFLTPTTSSEEHTFLGMTIILEDITEAKIVEKSKDEFLAVASHELRTPLTIIRGNSSMILEFYGEKLNDDLKTMIQDIKDSSIRLIAIANDFLDSSRLEQQKMTFNTTQFSIEEVIKDVIHELSSLANSKNIYLQMNPLVGVLPHVYADKDRTRQVIMNLIGNALKFTQKGGVTVTLSREEEDIRIEVADTGIGISLDQQKYLFQKFQQASQKVLTRDATTGAGMGLYICKLLIEKMKGKIYLGNSERGTGSVFIFTLPLVEEKGV